MDPKLAVQALLYKVPNLTKHVNILINIIMKLKDLCLWTVFHSDGQNKQIRGTLMEITYLRIHSKESHATSGSNCLPTHTIQNVDSVECTKHLS